MDTLSAPGLVPSTNPSAQFRSVEKSTAESRSPLVGMFSKISNRLWPEKPSAALRDLTSVRDRQSYAYASGEAEPPAYIAFELLRSPEGRKFLDGIMSGSGAVWWEADTRARRIAAALDRNLIIRVR